MYWVCYDSILLGADAKPGSCAARCTVDVNSGQCWRNETKHCQHESHEITFKDLESLNAMKNHCRYLATNFPFSAHKIPISEIFLTEMAKWAVISKFMLNNNVTCLLGIGVFVFVLFLWIFVQLWLLSVFCVNKMYVQIIWPHVNYVWMGFYMEFYESVPS